MNKKTYLSILLMLLHVHLCTAQLKGTLVVVNKADNAVSLINIESGKTKAIIPVEYGPHEAAVSPSGKLAAISNYGDQTVTGSCISIINISTQTKTKTIQLGEYTRPHGIEFINEEELIATCESKKVLLRIHISKETVEEIAGTAQSGSHMVAYSKTDNKAYITNVLSGTVSVIDIANRSLTKVILMKPGVEGLDISPDGKELWVANRNDSSVTVINTASFETIAVLKAHQLPFRVKFSPDNTFVAVSNAATGNISMFDVKTKVIKSDVDTRLQKDTPPFPVGIASHTQSEFFFACLAGYDMAAAISTKTFKVIKTYATGKSPDGIYYSSVII